jgi:anti-sigma regulatory factor (Ser/Thr protein kinase)
MKPQGEVRNGQLVHEAFFYTDLDGFLAGTVPFIRAGVAAGEPVLAAVPSPGLDALRAELGVDSDAVTLVDMAQAGGNPTSIIPMVLQAFADEHPGDQIRMIDEPIWPGRSPAEYATAVQHEALINLAFADRPATIRCPCQTTGYNRIRADASRTHPILLENGRRHRNVDYGDPAAVAVTVLRPLPDPPAAPTSMTFGVASLRTVRKVVGEFAGGVGMGTERIIELQFAVNEIATNTVVHTDGSGTLKVWQEDAAVVCEISDRGRITDPLAGRMLVGPGRPAGRGLLLAAVMSDLLQIVSHDSGTTMRIRKNNR